MAAGVPGLGLLPYGWPKVETSPASRLLLAGLVIVVAANLLAALAPPIDADSLAYHFALPKHFLTLGHLEFTPRAVDGAVPMLPHMTYLMALALGGERAMTLWCAISSWMVIPVMYVCSRRFLPASWALAFALLVQTVPAVTYGAVSGQVEIRLMLVTLPAILLAMDAVRARGGTAFRLAVLAGLLAGVYPAAKYPGLLFVFTMTAVMLPLNWRAALVAGCAVALAGGQWYVWNWWQSGDPVFPMLTAMLPLRNGIPWDAQQSRILFEVWSSSERILPHTFGWLLAYPVYAQLVDNPVFESGRTGFGPFALLVAPMACLGAWVRRDSILRHPLAGVLAMALLTYGLWFVLGPSQRLRHLLPLLPSALLVLLVAAYHSVPAWPDLRRPLMAALAGSLAIQLVGVGVASAKYVRYWTGGHHAEAWCERNVLGYRAARWINSHLRQGEGVAYTIRQIGYALDVPAFLAQPMYQRALPLRPSTVPEEFRRSLAALKLTHVLLPLSPGRSELDPRQGDLERLVKESEAQGCAYRVATINDVVVASHTLPSLSAVPTEIVVYRVGCP